MKFLQLFLCLLCISCIRELEYDDTSNIREIGINSILVESKNPIVEVYRTTPIYDSLRVDYLDSAKVRLIRSDEYEYDFLWLDEKKHYISSDQILSGFSYNLEVVIRDIIYSSSTSILPAARITSADFTLGSTVDEYGEPLTHLHVEIQSAGRDREFYQMFFIDNQNSESPEIINFWSFWNIADPVLVSESLLEYDPAYFVFTNNSFHENTIEIDLFRKGCYYGDSPCATDVVLRSVSEEYYKFLRSWIVHNYNQNNSTHVYVLDDLEPQKIFFQEQPIPLYSNIDGGVGVFGGFSESRVSFRHVD